jgi:hypothetical protein
MERVRKYGQYKRFYYGYLVEEYNSGDRDEDWIVLRKIFDIWSGFIWLITILSDFRSLPNVRPHQQSTGKFRWVPAVRCFWADGQHDNQNTVLLSNSDKGILYIALFLLHDPLLIWCLYAFSFFYVRTYELACQYWVIIYGKIILTAYLHIRYFAWNCPLLTNRFTTCFRSLLSLWYLHILSRNSQLLWNPKVDYRVYQWTLSSAT